MKINSILCAGFIGTALILGGCSTSGNTNAGPRNQVNVGSSNTVNKTSNPSVSENSTIGTSSSSHISNPLRALILESMQLARQGRVDNIAYFADKSNIDQVQRDWGAPTHEGVAGAGIYDTYQGKSAAFGFNKGGQIFDVRSFSPQFQKISYSDVLQTLGQPDDIRYYSGQTILLYTAGTKFQLLWIFEKQTESNQNPRLDHISVFCPQDTVNSMAAIQPAPTISLSRSNDAGGFLFKFSIMQKPTGYTLSEVEWIGNHGHSVVNTYHETVLHGTSGGIIPSFRISKDGAVFTFDYLSSMVGETGNVIAIFQAPSGQAMIGQSDPITLK